MKAPLASALDDAPKAVLRREALARRDALPAGERATAAIAIVARPFPVDVAPGAIVSGFIPMRSEINPIPLMQMLISRGVKLALPVVIGRGRPLVVPAWDFEEPLSSRGWG